MAVWSAVVIRSDLKIRAAIQKQVNADASLVWEGLSVINVCLTIMDLALMVATVGFLKPYKYICITIIKYHFFMDP